MRTGSGRSRTGWTRRFGARNGAFTPAAPGEIRNSFSEVNYRDPIVLRTHLHHRDEPAATVEMPHSGPVRNTPLLHNMWDA